MSCVESHTQLHGLNWGSLLLCGSMKSVLGICHLAQVLISKHVETTCLLLLRQWGWYCKERAAADIKHTFIRMQQVEWRSDGVSFEHTHPKAKIWISPLDSQSSRF